MPENDNFFSIPKAAKYCSISRGTLWKYVRMGELRASLTPGGHHRILKEDLEAFVLKKGMYPLAYKRFSKKRILIVDDDPKINVFAMKGDREIVFEILERWVFNKEVRSCYFSGGDETNSGLFSQSLHVS